MKRAHVIEWLEYYWQWLDSQLKIKLDWVNTTMLSPPKKLLKACSQVGIDPLEVIRSYEYHLNKGEVNNG